MTTALILAAGLGTRLRTVTRGPKWLVPVGSTSPMHEQLAAIAETDQVDRVVAVVSGDTSAVRAELAAAPIASVELVDNPDAHRWNNWSSALVGLEHVGGDGTVLLNSDLFAPRQWLRAGIEAIVRSPTPALLVDSERPLTDEAMKVAGERDLTAIGKAGVEDAVGEYVGMAWWPPGTARRLISVLRRYRDDPDAAQHWYEHGIQEDMRGGQPYARIATPSVHWVEIDDEGDHALARELIDAE